MKIYLSSWKKMFSFEGRATRKEFFISILGNMLLLILVSISAALIGPLLGMNENSLSFDLLGKIIIFIFLIPTFVLSLPVLTRRLHDTNRSGGFVLLLFIPLVGGLILFVFALLEGTSGDNKFGAPSID